MGRPCLVVLAIVLAACGAGHDVAGDDAADAAAAPDAPVGPLPTVFGGERPATLIVPDAYEPGTPMPLVLVLHGYFTDPGYVVSYMQLQSFAEDHGVLVIAPHGTVNPAGWAFWNATDACCDLYDSGVDDEAYLLGLVEDIRAAYDVDPGRIYAMGHSNGGFMSLRLACRHADVFAAVISHAGAADAADCAPERPVSVLQVHGSADAVIGYNGGTISQMNGELVPYPSAADTVATLAGPDGCAAATEDLAPLDLTTDAGSETTRTRHTGCPAGVDAELWTVPGGSHFLSFGGGASDAWWAWLSAHGR